MNKNISVWRGDNTPPTNYHIWLKNDGKLYEYKASLWLSISSNSDNLKNYLETRLSEEINTLSGDDKNKSIRQIAEDVMNTVDVGVLLITEDEYDLKLENGDIVNNLLYFITEDNEPYKLYIGLHLIAKKEGLDNVGFPYIFPIIF